MSGTQTHGYDIVIQVSESELNRQLAIHWENNPGNPWIIDQPFQISPMVGNFHFEIHTPSLDLDSEIDNGIGLTVLFQDSTILLTQPQQRQANNLRGRIEIEDRVTVEVDGKMRQVIVQFNDGIDNVISEFDRESRQEIERAFGDFGITPEMVEQAMSLAIRQVIPQRLSELPLSPRISMGKQGNSNITFKELDARVINDQSAADRDTLAYLLRAGSPGSVYPERFTKASVRKGGTTVLIISNDWFLCNQVRPKLATALKLKPEDFKCPCELKQPRKIEKDGQDILLKSLKAFVVKNYIRVEGSFDIQHTVGRAKGTFGMKLYLETKGDTIKVRPEIEKPKGAHLVVGGG